MSAASEFESDWQSRPASVPSPLSDVIAANGTIVVKVGTRVLTDADGRLDRRRIDKLSDGLCEIAATGRQTILVSSGAVAAGVARLNLVKRPVELAKLQAVAAVGQADLIQAYENALSQRGRHAAQVLLTAEDLRRRSGYLNVRNALSEIHGYGAIAIINENDSVAVAELMTTFGDNDSLAAQVAGLFTDAILIILSDVAGLYDGPPERSSSHKIDVVEKVDAAVRSMAVPHDGNTSKGGMTSKLNAAAIGNSHGQATIVAPGTDDTVLQKIMAGEVIGTLFQPSTDAVRGRRRWIGTAARIEGTLQIDSGAAHAIRGNQCSLLTVGMTAVSGKFARGSVVSIIDPDGREVARGLANYTSDEAAKLCGHHSDEVEAILGHRPHDSIVHRDNMSLTLPR